MKEWISLNMTPQIGPRAATKLLEKFGSAGNVFHATRGELEWHRPSRMTLQNLLRHPVYAGYYRWGHRQVDARRKVAGRPSTGRTSRSPKDCLVLLEGRCPAYLTMERY